VINNASTPCFFISLFQARLIHLLSAFGDAGLQGDIRFLRKIFLMMVSLPSFGLYVALRRYLANDPAHTGFKNLL
jgi:hypothetical protein